MYFNTLPTTLFISALFSTISAAPTDSTVSSRSLLNVHEFKMQGVHPALGYPLTIEAARVGRSGLSLANSFDQADDEATRVGLYGFEKLYGYNFDKVASRLPQNSTVFRAPWPGSYWPTMEDSINFRRKQNLSAVEKYAIHNSMDPKKLEDDISKYVGIDSMASLGLKNCTQNSDCGSDKCAKRRNATEGYCIPYWFGICHAWVPASILELEPRCPVTVGNVTYTLDDMRALATVMYDRTKYGTVFGGNRCDDNNSPTDEHGRFIDKRCRDITPDLFHLVMTNVVGRFKNSFVVDIVGTSEVWNQPVYGYQFNQTEVTFEQAAKLISPNKTTYETDAAKLMHVQIKVQYIVEGGGDQPLTDEGVIKDYFKEKKFEYILELNNDGEIIGAEWSGNSKTDHPDFLWMPTTYPSYNTEIQGIKYSVVKELLQKSQTGCLYARS